MSVKADELRAVYESVDEGDDAGGRGEHVGPFAEGLVGSEDNGALEVTSGDDLEQEVGVAVVVVQIPDLVND